MTRYLSQDGKHRVTVVAPDGRQAFRVEQLGNHGKTWYRVADVYSPDGIAKYVPLHELVAQEGEPA